MQFMLFSHLPWPEGREPRQIFEDTTGQIQLAEELGFASAWLAEHHFSRYGLGSSQLILAAKIAALTNRIRLGTAVLVPPLHHPVRLAEDIAMLDQVSGGRLEIGFGRGSSGYEYAGFGANGTPMAVLLDADGKVASDLAVGADAVLARASAENRTPTANHR